MSSTRSAREISDQITNTGTVHIRLVGPDTRYWSIQKSLLRHHSSYFHAILSPDTLDQTIHDLEALQPGILSPILSSSSPSIINESAAKAAPFELFVQWIYTGTIDPAPTLAKSDIDLDVQQLDIYIRLFCICAESYLNVLELASLALTRMYELYHICRQRQEKNPSAFFFTAAHVEYIFKNTQPQSLLRKIALQVSVYDYLKQKEHAADDDFYSPHQPSYAYKAFSVAFANDLLDAVRHYIVSYDHKSANNSPKHPFHNHQKDLEPKPSSPLPLPPSSILVPAPIAAEPASSPPTTPPPSAPSPAPLPDDASFITPTQNREQGLGIKLDAHKDSTISSSSLSFALTQTPPLSTNKTATRTSTGTSTGTSSRSNGAQNRGREKDGSGQLGVPPKGLFTPAATPTKQSQNSISRNVRRRSLGNWVLDVNANANANPNANANAASTALAPAMGPAMDSAMGPATPSALPTALAPAMPLTLPTATDVPRTASIDVGAGAGAGAGAHPTPVPGSGPGFVSVTINASTSTSNPTAEEKIPLSRTNSKANSNPTHHASVIIASTEPSDHGRERKPEGAAGAGEEPTSPSPTPTPAPKSLPATPAAPIPFPSASKLLSASTSTLLGARPLKNENENGNANGNGSGNQSLGRVLGGSSSPTPTPTPTSVPVQILGGGAGPGTGPGAAAGPVKAGEEAGGKEEVEEEEEIL